MMRRSALLLPLLAALSACGHSPATTFLVLDPAPPTQAPLRYAGPPVRVPFVHLPITIDRPEAVHQDAAGVLTVEDFARWSAPLGLQARNTLIGNLTQRLPAGAVLPPDAAPHDPELRVDVTILSFVTGGGQATLTASYQLAPTRLPQTRPTIVQVSAPATDTAPSATAVAMSACLASLSDRLAEAIVRSPQSPAPKGR